MNRYSFRNEGQSSPRLVHSEDDVDDDDDDDEDWSTDESSSMSSLHGNSAGALDRAIRPPSSSDHRRDQSNDGEGNSETYQPQPVSVKSSRKRQQKRQDIQSIPLVPYIDDQFPPSQPRHTHTRTRTSTRTAHHHHRRPSLIETIQTEWHNARSRSNLPHLHHGGGDGLPNLEQILSAPKVRRWGLVGFVFLGFLWVNWGLWARARWREHVVLKNAASVSMSGAGEREKLGLNNGGLGSFGTNLRAEFGGMVHLRSLGEGEGYDHDYELRGGQETTTNNDENKSKKRLVVVGDVHGCIDECEFCFSYTYSYLYTATSDAFFEDFV